MGEMNLLKLVLHMGLSSMFAVIDSEVEMHEVAILTMITREKMKFTITLII